VRPVVVLILHAAAPKDAGPLARALAEARHSLATRLQTGFLAAGAGVAEVVAGPPDGLSFGERLAAEMRARSRGAGGAMPPGGLIVLGSGSIPLARAADLRRFVEAAAGPGGHALANNRYSADVVAISRAADLAELPPLPADNALPRWLEERTGVAVTDLRAHWRLGVDVDTPLDLLLLGLGAPLAWPAATAPLIGERLAALSDVVTNRRAELLVAGRVSATTLRWLESGVACRVRALVEERGLHSASRLAQSGATTGSRPPRSVLGELLDRDGPESLARTAAKLADAAVIDTRVLLAHRHGAEEAAARLPAAARPGPAQLSAATAPAAWPSPEDRFASDLLLPEAIADPWLRALTETAVASDLPILLGGHTAVNGGLRLLATRAGLAARARAGKQ
jgi:hypothetical protein